MIGFMIGSLVSLVFVLLLFKGLWSLWHKMHALVGIEVGTPRLGLGYQQGVALPTRITSQDKLALPTHLKKTTKQTYWRTRYGKVPALRHLSVTADQLDLMPVEAVQLLGVIDERLSRYAAWQHNQTNASGKATNHKLSTNLSQNWLTEKQFVLQRLVEQTIPEAVNQYDQLARFHPQALAQPIHDGMNAAQVLMAVLTEVDGQIDGLLDELSAQVSAQLATTYRYVKTRTQ